MLIKWIQLEISLLKKKNCQLKFILKCQRISTLEMKNHTFVFQDITIMNTGHHGKQYMHHKLLLFYIKISFLTYHTQI